MHLWRQWWNLPVRSRLTGTQWNMNLSEWSDMKSKHTAPSRSRALGRCGRQLFWSSGLITSLSVSLSHCFLDQKKCFYQQAQRVGGNKGQQSRSDGLSAWVTSSGLWSDAGAACDKCIYGRVTLTVSDVSSPPGLNRAKIQFVLITPWIFRPEKVALFR